MTEELIVPTLEISIPNVEWEMFPNMCLVWARGKEGVLEVLERPLNSNYYGVGSYAFVKDSYKSPLKLYNYHDQIEEYEYTKAWMYALDYAYRNPTRWIHFVRQDCEKVVPETLENAPMRIVNGECVKIDEVWLVQHGYHDTNRGWIFR